MNIVWSDEALDDIEQLRTYIAQDNPHAARRVAIAIVDAVTKMLPSNPEIGRPGRVSGTRELVIPRLPYIVPYRVRNETIQVLRVYHGARKWPERF
ncbi:type II toxin-antitoxin system RelE/ParE family toxin [Methylovirgula sp. 4M-Z18]|uniref:type II toxin-antitoxin system RelE/ParE family toxin n=1 Tax=Methylovirgula sp. 4M-Z18 TaxID=2293567 RepID=UPI000E2FB880|nr:type II toxin-antitoxin system RelE/ParE family toxin [Methylovirgula sp. 4M-Z18]RFB78487.1 type II toxin-antitoxin system RelE/ParE family toxin [Methylovirgula sp. 4M-Z18]